MKKYYKDYLDNKIELDKTLIIGIFSLIIVATGIFGFIYEYIFYFFNGGMKEFYWRGANFLPWINIYATGSIMIYILTKKFKKKPLFIFIISFFSTGILEYLSGYFMLKLTGMRCWDYNTEILSFGNIDGFVCLRSVTFFAISGLLLMYVIVPLITFLAKKMNRKLFLTISIFLCSIFIFDELYNLLFARILSLPRARDIYTSLGIKYMNYK